MKKQVAYNLADFIRQASFKNLSREVITGLKIHILDSIGCALGALGASQSSPVVIIREYMDEFGGPPYCSMIGGGKVAPCDAAFFNSALVRYLDFNDSFIAKGETCHPSDNLGALLSVGQYVDGDGKDLLVALAVAYQVQCRLCELAPLRDRGFDNSTHGSYATVAGISKMLGLDAGQIVNAIGIAGVSHNTLRVLRTGSPSHWNGLAYADTALGAVRAAFLAMGSVTGPADIFEGRKGFMEVISGEFNIDWKMEKLDAVLRTSIKRYNAEIHAQSAIEGMLELRNKSRFRAEDVERVDAEIFDVALEVIGGSDYMISTKISMKEQADHSLNYLLSVALIDGQVMPEQFREGRLHSDEVATLMEKIKVKPSAYYSARFPAELPVLIVVTLKNGMSFKIEKNDYEGFVTRPATWRFVENKFHRLAEAYIDAKHRYELVDFISHLEAKKIVDLMSLLETGLETVIGELPHAKAAS
ncbi:MAG: MmgE/PrpD family protein [Bdellovibrionota bacterium]